MTEQHDLDPAQEPVHPPESQVDAPEETGAVSGPNREAAKYRTKLRETEAERDRLRTQIDTLRRAI